MRKYSASFTSGALLLDEMDILIPIMVVGDKNEAELEQLGTDQLKINAERSRQRKYREIQKRFVAVDKSVWDLFLSLDTPEEKAIIAYYAVLKTYNLVMAFHLEVVLDKWLSGNLELRKDDFFNFLMKKKDSHPEIDEWAESTLHKIATTNLLMLREVGILKNDNLVKLLIPHNLATFFGKSGEWWFLESMFMTRDEMRVIAKSMT